MTPGSRDLGRVAACVGMEVDQVTAERFGFSGPPKGLHTTGIGVI